MFADSKAPVALAMEFINITSATRWAYNRMKYHKKNMHIK